MIKVVEILCCVFLLACVGEKKANIEKVNSQDLDSTKSQDFDSIKINEFAIKEGNVIKIFTENDTLVFKSEPHLEEQSEVFEYKEFNATNKFHVICAQYWESYNCYLVDHKTGQIHSVWQDPVFSPNDRFLVSKSLDYGLEGVPNGFQVWQLVENRDWIKKLEIDQQQWIPVSFNWISNDSFNVKTVTVQHFEDKGWNYKSLTDFQNIKFGIENE